MCVDAVRSRRRTLGFGDARQSSARDWLLWYRGKHFLCSGLVGDVPAANWKRYVHLDIRGFVWREIGTAISISIYEGDLVRCELEEISIFEALSGVKLERVYPSRW